MTSIPASRSARATTFAPRSCPSSPGFAMSTRILRPVPAGPGVVIAPTTEAVAFASEDRGFFVFAPDLAQGVAHLAQRGVRAGRFDHGVHEVVAAARGAAQALQRGVHARVVAPL